MYNHNYYVILVYCIRHCTVSEYDGVPLQYHTQTTLSLILTHNGTELYGKHLFLSPPLQHSPVDSKARAHLQ